MITGQPMMPLYHGTTLSNLNDILQNGFRPGTHFTGEFDIAAYYAEQAAEHAGEDKGVVLYASIPAATLRPDWIALQEPVLASSIDRDSHVDRLREQALNTLQAEIDADRLDEIVEEFGLYAFPEEELHAYLEEVGWPEEDEWQRAFVMVSSVVARDRIPTLNIHDDHIEIIDVGTDSVEYDSSYDYGVGSRTVGSAAALPAPRINVENWSKRFTMKECPDIVWDCVEGVGSAGYTSSINYFGVCVLMWPHTFLNLATRLSHPGSLEPFEELRLDPGIAPPFLMIRWDEENDRAYVSGHEGRHRAMFVDQKCPAARIPVHLIVIHYRAHDLTPEMIRSMRDGMQTERNVQLRHDDSRWLRGPLFDTVFWRDERIDFDDSASVTGNRRLGEIRETLVPQARRIQSPASRMRPPTDKGAFGYQIHVPGNLEDVEGEDRVEPEVLEYDSFAQALAFMLGYYIYRYDVPEEGVVPDAVRPGDEIHYEDGELAALRAEQHLIDDDPLLFDPVGVMLLKLPPAAAAYLLNRWGLPPSADQRLWHHLDRLADAAYQLSWRVGNALERTEASPDDARRARNIRVEDTPGWQLYAYLDYFYPGLAEQIAQHLRAGLATRAPEHLLIDEEPPTAGSRFVVPQARKKVFRHERLGDLGEHEGGPMSSAEYIRFLRTKPFPFGVWASLLAVELALVSAKLDIDDYDVEDVQDTQLSVEATTFTREIADNAWRYLHNPTKGSASMGAPFYWRRESAILSGTSPEGFLHRAATELGRGIGVARRDVEEGRERLWLAWSLAASAYTANVVPLGLDPDQAVRARREARDHFRRLWWGEVKRRLPVVEGLEAEVMW